MAAVLEALNARKQRVFRDRVNPLSFLTDREVIERYRLSKEAIIYVYNLIKAECSPRTDRSRPLNALTKLLITLRYLAKGDFYSELADIHGVSRSSVSRSIKQVVSAINKKLKNIKFPQDAEEQTETKVRFHQKAKFPNVLGAIDGTLVPIIAPRDDEQIYVCRKRFHALNIQGVVDSNLRFTHISARWPGSTHDAVVFENSDLKTYLETANVGWLIGDSGYPLRPYLMTPKVNATSEKEIGYNNAHSKTRVCVERAFSLLKSRFRCLHKSGGCLPFHPSKCVEIVTVCAKLHNLCHDFNVPCLTEIVEDDMLNHDIANMQFVGPVNRTAHQLRLSLIDMF